MLTWMTEDPLTVVLVCGGLGFVALGVLLLAVERVTRPNPGYVRRHDEAARVTRQEWREELGWDDRPAPAWRGPSGSWRMPGRASHHAEAGPAHETRQLHPGYYAAGRATVFQRPPRDEED